MINTRTITLSVITATTLLASPPSVGDIEKQIIIPKVVKEKKEINNEIPDFAPKPSVKGSEKVSTPTEESTLLVTKFEFEGNEHIAKEKLDELLKSYVGKSYSFEELKKITSVVTKHYRDNGYFVARAYIAQGAVDGETLNISIIEGNYGEFKLTNSSLVNDKQIQGILNDATKSNVISVNTIERAMLLINDTPGAKVTKADIMPGSLVGTSDFAITTEATKPYNAYVIGDNYGSRYTGIYRLNLGLNANSPLGYGDKLSLNGLISNTGDLKNGRVAYGFPLMSNGLRGEVSASKTTYSLADEYEALDAIGNSTTLEAKLTYPIIRSREETLNVSMGFAHKNMKDEVRSVDLVNKKESDAITLGGDYSRSCLFFGYNSSTNASLYVTYGDLSINDETSRAQDASGAKTEGTYSKIFGNIEKYVQFNQEYSFITSLRFQKALSNKNLDGSEDFSLGGAYGVRAFPDGEHSAENGYILGVEFFYALPSIEAINHKVSIFADTGYANMQNNFANDPSRQLSDIGVGYQASYGDFFTKIQIARVIGGEKVSSESEYSTRALLQLGWIY